MNIFLTLTKFRIYESCSIAGFQKIYGNVKTSWGDVLISEKLIISFGSVKVGPSPKFVTHGFNEKRVVQG